MTTPTVKLEDTANPDPEENMSESKEILQGGVGSDNKDSLSRPLSISDALWDCSLLEYESIYFLSKLLNPLTS